MSSKNRKFRKKQEEPSAAQTEDATAGSLPIKSLSSSTRDKEKKPKKASLLSFDDEEGGSPVKVKSVIKERSKPKLRPNLQGLSLKEDAKPSSTQQSGAGELSKAILCWTSF